MKEILEMYEMLNEEQKNKIFTSEQRKILDGQLFFKKLFNDPSFYNAVETAVGEAVYETLRA